MISGIDLFFGIHFEDTKVLIAVSPALPFVTTFKDYVPNKKII
jgi:hypothetical protein